MIRRGIRVALAVGLLAACAERGWIYEKKNVTPTRYDHDVADCRRVATDPKTFAVFSSGRVDRATFNRCMERKGYTVGRAE